MTEHRTYRRERQNSEYAVLFVHGICSSPVFFDAFYKHVPDDWAITSILLDGHGGTTKDFSNTSMKTWRQQVSDAVDKLATEHRQLLLVGHSMGTLLSIEQGIRRPDKIKALFLLAVPLKARPTPGGARDSVRVALGLPISDDPSALAAKKLYSIQPDRKLWRYLGFLPRYRELTREMRATRSRAMALSIPSYIFQSRHDEIVSKKSYAILAKNPKLELHWLEDSDHKYYPPNDQAYLLQSFERVCSDLAKNSSLLEHEN